MELSEEKIVELYRTMEQKRPIVHCITNAVTVNDCANILLAVGAITDDGTSSAGGSRDYTGGNKPCL